MRSLPTRKARGGKTSQSPLQPTRIASDANSADAKSRIEKHPKANPRKEKPVLETPIHQSVVVNWINQIHPANRVRKHRLQGSSFALNPSLRHATAEFGKPIQRLKPIRSNRPLFRQQTPVERWIRPSRSNRRLTFLPARQKTEESRSSKLKIDCKLLWRLRKPDRSQSCPLPLKWSTRRRTRHQLFPIHDSNYRIQLPQSRSFRSFLRKTALTRATNSRRLNGFTT